MKSGSWTLACIAGLCLSVCTAGARPESVRELRAVDMPQDGSVGVYRFKDWTPMEVDLTQVAVKAEDGAALNMALTAAGLKGAEAKEIGIRGWWLVTVTTAKTPGQIRDIVLKLAGNAAVEFASPVMVGNEGLPVWVTPGVMAGYVDGTEVSSRDALTAMAGVKPGQGRWENFPDMDYHAVDAKDGYAVLDAANTLAVMPDVAFAEADLMITASQNLIPNDPFFNQQWAVHNTGQSGGAVDFDMDGPEAWDVTIGSGSIVAVVMDIGMQLNHPDLNTSPFNGDFTGNGTGGAPGNQCDNHGTAVASCIGSIINNGAGVAGIAPGCRVASARIGVSQVPCNGFWNGNLSWSADALNWAQANGARVTNNSNSYGGTSAAVETAYANTRNAGLVHFASAGNGGVNSIAYPSSIAGVNSVAAMNRFGNRSGFSQWGAGLDFSAPGESILTSDRTGGDGYVAGDVAQVDGTSFASPYAAGIACLILSKNSSLSAAQVEGIMAATCMDRGAAGYDTDFGWGMVQARGALDGTPAPGPANNGCGAAIDVSVGGTFNGTLAGATNDGTTNCGSAGSSPDVWYTYTAPNVGGTLTVTTCGTHDASGVDTGIDTVVSLHGSCGGATLTCNDDAGGFCGASDGGFLRDSAVQLNMTPGQTVKIRVANFNNGPTGPFRLNVSYALANDACAGATDVSAGGTFNGTLFNATADGPGICGNSDGNPDVWYSYTQGSCPGQVTVTTCGSTEAYGIDTVVSMFDACGGNVIACNDDSDCSGVSTLNSTVSANLAAGQTVKIRVSKFGGRIIGNFFLNVSSGVGANDLCGNATAIGDGTYTVCNTLASTDGPAEPGCGFCCGDTQVNNDMWFRYVAPGSGTLTVDLCSTPGQDFDSKLAAYVGGCPTTPGTAIACNDDACGPNGLMSSMQFTIVSGQTYLIRFGGYSTSRGSAVMNVHAAVTCPADFNGDGFLDFFDYDDYVVCFETGNCPPGKTADFNGDQFVDFFDYDDYVVAFETGC